MENKIVQLPTTKNNRTLLASEEIVLPALLQNENLLFPGNPPRFQQLVHEKRAEQLYPEIVMGWQTVVDYLTPADVEEIAVELELLRARYPAFNGDDVDTVADALEDEWLDDLAEFPLGLIRKARRNWRMSDTAFAPRSAGQLMASVRSEFYRLKAIERRAEGAMKACEALGVGTSC